MDAVKFLKTLRRMCNAKCRKCEFGEVYRVNGGCSTWQKNHPEEAVAIADRIRSMTDKELTGVLCDFRMDIIVKKSQTFWGCFMKLEGEL